MIRALRTPLLFAALSLSPLPLLAQAAALARLENSPRHHEWVEIKRDDKVVHAFVTYPEVKDKAMAVLVIHENRGLTDWVRSVTDRLAEAGYIAIAPDLLSGAGPNGGKTSDFASSDAAREALGKLVPADVLANLQATGEYARKLPAANGKLAVIGFCWGGSNTWRFALSGADVVVACPFYGTAPAEGDYTKVKSEVHGFYGGNDARVNATLDKTKESMTAAGKVFEPVLYDGAGHAYMRSGEEADASAANKAAMEKSWERLLGLLKKAK